MSGGTDFSVSVNSPVYSFNITTFAPDGNIVAANDTVNGNWSYTYDQFNRLNTAVASAISKGCQESYDRFGNRWSQQPYGGTGFSCNPFSPSFTGNGNGNNNRMDTYSYDAAGNLLNDGLGHTYTYDAENRILTVNGSTNYVYDAQGRRVAKKNGSTITNEYLFNLGGATVVELNSSGGTVRQEIYAGGQHLGTYAGGTTVFTQADWLGTERSRSNMSAAQCQTTVSLPFGDGTSNPFNTCNPTPEFFTGKPRDIENNLDYLGARYYANIFGRFTSPDEFFADQKPEEPQSWNLYTYVRNDVTKLIDENGHGAVAAAVREARRLLEQRLVAAARQEGVRLAWKAERELIITTGRGSRDWTKAQIKELVETGKVKGFVGHHINSVAGHDLEMARNPNNIKFVEGQAENLAEHGGDFRNKTTGSLIDRLSKLGGPALLVFFEVYEEKMTQYTSHSECPMCSNPNSWWATLNPWNNLVESPALVEALAAAAAADQEQPRTSDGVHLMCYSGSCYPTTTKH
jgi:RHS repeat-associated protein